jgi:hypothetical protein
MSGKKSAASNHSVAFVKSPKKSSTSTRNLTEENQEDYVKTIIKKSSHDKNEESSSIDEDEESSSSTDDDEEKSSSRTVTLCTMCGRYKGFRMRRKLFIILCIAIALLVFLLGVIIVLYAVVPAIVRSTISKAELSFRSVNIEDIQNDRFRLRAQLELSRTGSIAATILPPLVITVDSVGKVTNNEPIVITGDSSSPTVVPIDSPFVVSDLNAFHDFSRSLIFKPQVIWHLTAKESIQPISSIMPVYSNIPFNKEVKLDALNSLQNVNIKSVSLRRSDAQRIHVDIIIEIPNPSVFSIDLGK